jgi:polysaccharide biosynthesis protein PslH
MPKRRLLICLSYTPRVDARHGGRATTERLLRLDPRFELGLLCLRAPGELPVDAAVRERFALVEQIPIPDAGASSWGRARRRARLLYGLIRGKPIWASDTAVPEFAARLRQITEEWAPDLVEFEPVVMAQYSPALRSVLVPRLLVEAEPGISRARDLWRASRGFEHLILGADLLAWKRYEPARLADFDVVVVFTERDRHEVSVMAPTQSVTTIPLGSEIPREPLDPLGSSPPSIVFVGGYRHPPNVDAALRLAREIFPALARLRPDLRLYLVGPDPPEKLRRLADGRVVVTGEVDQVVPYLDRAAMVVAPVRLGGGMRLKLGEALAAGKAVVASPLACEGYDVVDGEQLLIVESNEEFVQAIDELLGDDQRRGVLAAQARAWAERHLGWDAAAIEFARLYDSVISRGASSDSS